MRAFRELYDELDATTSTNAKVAALERFFRTAPAEDGAWALALMTGRRPRRVVSAAALVRWARDVSGVESWLFDECMMAVGDTAETISLVLEGVGVVALREAGGAGDVSEGEEAGLATWMEERILPLRGLDEADQRARVTQWWREHDRGTVYILCKLLTGGLRVGASKTLAIRGLAAAIGRDVAEVSHRVMGDWRPTAGFIRSLAEDVSTVDATEREAVERASRPYPFFLASPIESAPGAAEAIAAATGASGARADATPEAVARSLADAIGRVLGPITGYQLEWKWDGIRAQLIRRGGRTFLWSRGEELITERFPEIVEAARRLPDGCVLDGEVLAWKDGRAMGFQSLQRRIAREDVSRQIRVSVPCVFMAYDVLELDGVDIREKTTGQRREIVERVVAAANAGTGVAGVDVARLLVSPRVEVVLWEEAAMLRAGSRERGVEGLMVKSLDAPYRVGRVKGDWWKWKIEPYSADLVLIYAQPGHGRRAGLLTDYGFAAWENGSLVAVTKAYSGLNQREIEELDGWIRAHTRERFGPVRSVDATHVFEIAFEGAALSGRNRSGIALRFPRISRWRRDKTPADADSIESIRTLVSAHGNQPPKELGLFGQLD
jgi:DNA ligase-1